jgi:hypothetical protein
MQNGSVAKHGLQQSMELEGSTMTIVRQVTADP